MRYLIKILKINLKEAEKKISCRPPPVCEDGFNLDSAIKRKQWNSTCLLASLSLLALIWASYFAQSISKALGISPYYMHRKIILSHGWRRAWNRRALLEKRNASSRQIFIKSTFMLHPPLGLFFFISLNHTVDNVHFPF